MRALLLPVAALVLAVPLVASANSAPLLVTGGGQVFAATTTDDTAGPGDTVAFGAVQRSDGSAYGSVTFLDTSESDEGARPAVIFNGVVTCVVADPDEGRKAYVGGHRRAGDGPQFFTLEVTDTGQEARGTDVIEFYEDTDNDRCDDEATGDGWKLARGNAKVDTARSGR